MAGILTQKGSNSTRSGKKTRNYLFGGHARTIIKIDGKVCPALNLAYK